MSQYYVRYFTLYQNSPTRFAGPFGSRDEAIDAAEAGLPEVVWAGQMTHDARRAWNAHVVPAHQVRAGEFRRFVRDWYDVRANDEDSQFAPLPFHPEAVESRRLRGLIESA